MLQRLHSVTVREYRLFSIVGAISVWIALASTVFGWFGAPVPLRFFVGLLTYGFAPGLLMLLALGPKRVEERDPVVTVLMIISLSFSCNFILNVILFTVNPSFQHLSQVYVCVLAFLFAAVPFSKRFAPGLCQILGRELQVRFTIPGLLVLLILVAAFSALLLVIYLQGGAPLTNTEELAVLRKLAENPSVRYNNISFRAGDPTTYFFIPLQIFITGVGMISGLDISLIYSLFWVVTAFVSISAMVWMAKVISNDVVSTIVMAVLCLSVSFFDANSVIYSLGLMTPYPNRYGFSSGVLLPLNLLLFLSIFRWDRLNPVITGTLLYLTVEMTFVHARETMFFLAFMTITLLFVVRNFKEHRSHFLHIALLIVMTFCILIVYKAVNLALSSRLDVFVNAIATETKTALVNLVNDEGVWNALYKEGPASLFVHAKGADAAIMIPVPNYGSVFIQYMYPSRLILPLFLLCLPLYILTARSLVQLVFASVITILSLSLMSGLVTLGISAIVGNPEIFSCINIVYIIAFCGFAHMVSLVCASESLLRQKFGMRAFLVITAFLCVAAVLVNLNAPFCIEWLKKEVISLWTPGFYVPLHLVTLILIALKYIKGKLPFFPDTIPGSQNWCRGIICFVLLAMILGPIASTSEIWKRNPIVSFNPPSDYTGEFAHDYGLLRKNGKLPVLYPLSVVSFLRRNLPPNQVVIGTDTFSAVMATSHYIAFINNAGNRPPPPELILNWDYIAKHQLKNSPFYLKDFLLADSDLKALRYLLHDLRVDIVIVTPEESEEVHRIWGMSKAAQEILKPVFSEDCYIIYKVVSL